MKVCTCPRCDFFAMAALDLLALGETDAAEMFAAEVTILVKNDGEGYADLWTVDTTETVATEMN